MCLEYWSEVMAAGIIEIWASSSKDCIADLVFIRKKRKRIEFCRKDLRERERNQVFQISFYPEKDKKKRIGFCRWWDLRELDREHKVADLFFIQKKNRRKIELGFGEESWERQTEIGFMHSQSLRGRLVATLQRGWGVWSWDFELRTLLLHVFWLWQINAWAQNECLWNSKLDLKKTTYTRLPPSCIEWHWRLTSECGN